MSAFGLIADVSGAYGSGAYGSGTYNGQHVQSTTGSSSSATSSTSKTPSSPSSQQIQLNSQQTVPQPTATTLAKSSAGLWIAVIVTVIALTLLFWLIIRIWRRKREGNPPTDASSGLTT